MSVQHNRARGPRDGLVSDASFLSDGRGRNWSWEGRLEWRVLDLSTGELVYESPVLGFGCANVGEFLGAVEGLRQAAGSVYCDNLTAIGWVKDGECRTSMPYDAETTKCISEAEAWLKENPEDRLRLKFWNTRKWGENPADYGRK